TKGSERETLECHRRALPLAQAAFGPRHPQVAAIYEGMSAPIAITNPRDRKEACAVLERAREILEASVEPDNARLIGVLTSLAFCWSEDRQLDRAGALFQDILRRTTVLSTTRATAYAEYGHFMGTRGQFEEG